MFFLYTKGSFNYSKKIKSITVLSGDFDWDSIERTKIATKIYQNINYYPHFIICGKFKSKIMKEIANQNKIKHIIIQNKSTNTYEDAHFLKEIMRNNDIFPTVLVTSSIHTLRSFHTFKRVFPKKEIYFAINHDFSNIYSPFLLTGWLGRIINIFKDYKYNGRFS